MDYARVSLEHPSGMERVTIDMSLSFGCASGTAAFPGLAIVEVKQPRHSESRALTLIRHMRWRPTTFSKYCIGVLALYPSAPRHGFHLVLREIGRSFLLQSQDARSL